MVHGDEAVENRAAESFSVNTLLDKSNLKRTSLRKDTDASDYVVDNVLSTNSNISVWLNKKNYLVDRIELHKAGMVATVDFRQYRRVDGIAVPSVMDMSYAGLPLAVHMTLQSFDDHVHPGYDMFAPPATKTTLLDKNAPNESPVQLPFTLVHNEIVLSATLNGQKVKMILDTGAGSSFVSSALAKVLGLQPKAEVPAEGYGGSSEVSIATKATISLSPTTLLDNQLLYIMPDGANQSNIKTSTGADGVLGYDVLTRFITAIDYTLKTVTLFPPNSYHVPTDQNVVTIPISLQLRAPLISAKIDGHVGRFLVDTGDSGSVHLYNAFAHQYGFDAITGGTKSEGRGVGGGVLENTTAGHTLQLGAMVLTNIDASTMSGPGVNSFSELAGGIGNAVLQRCDPVFDYSRGLLYLKNFNPEPVSSAQMTLKQLLAKHANALGGLNSINKIKSTRIEAVITTGNTQGTVVSEYEFPYYEREADKLGFVNTSQGYNGNFGWKQGENGEVRHLSSNELRDLKTQVFFDSTAYLNSHLPTGTVRLDSVRGPHGEYFVDLDPPHGRPSTIAIDPDTFLIDYETHQDDFTPVKSEFTDYRKVDGVMFPFHQHISNGASRYDIDITVSAVKNNLNIPHTDFEPPKSANNVTLLDAKLGSARLALNVKSGFILVRCSIDGHKKELILDTGSAGIALTKAFSLHAGLKSMGILEAKGYGGSTDYQPTYLHKIVIGGKAVIQDVTAGTITLPVVLANYLPKDVVGFIGYDLFSRFVVTLDVQHDAMILSIPSKFSPPSRSLFSKVQLFVDRDLPSVDVSINGISNTRLLVDTGDGANLRLYGSFISAHKLPERTPKVELYGGGIGGVSEARAGSVKTLKIGSRVFRNVSAEFSTDSAASTSDIYAGALGAGIAEHTVLIFDYPHSALYLANSDRAKRLN